MSQMVDSDRSNEQCRSHHQKMLKRFGTIEEIIKSLGKEISEPQIKIEEDRISSTQEGLTPIHLEDLEESGRSYEPRE